MRNFVKFILSKVYNSEDIPDQYIDLAFELTFKDVKYHFSNITALELLHRICTNSNELAIYLFRLGTVLHQNGLENSKLHIHWLLKELCGCELYFNNIIEEGFYIVHGGGTVIGSRNSIGKGFKIHQGCTIGHKKNGEGKGVVIGNDVTIYCNSSVLGELHVGDNVIVGAHVLIHSDIPNNTIVVNKNKNSEKYIKTI